MKLRVVVCDDNELQMDIIVSFIKEIDTRYDIEVTKASNGEILLHEIKDKELDIAFLDIEMEGLDGIEIGKRIRNMYQDAIIVYITGFKDHALNAFEINAFNYIIKPLTKEKFKKVMKDIILRYHQIRALNEKKKELIIMKKEETINLKYGEIYFFEKCIRKIKTYTVKGEYEFYGSLKKLKEDIDMNNSFVQCHQGFIVNRSKIIKLQKDQIFLREINASIPVSRRFKETILNVLVENIF